MVQKAARKIKFFFLAHGTMGLECLKSLVKLGRTPEFAVIHEKREREKLDSDFFFPFIEFCDENSIELKEITKLEKLKSEIAKCGIGLCSGFMEIIKKEIYSLPEFGILNLHCGKLPQYRGRAPINRTIMNGDDELTMTIHQIDEGVDSGDILFEKKYKIGIRDDVNSLYSRCSETSGKVFEQCLKMIENGKYKYSPQEFTTNPPHKTFKEDERKITWSEGVKKVYNKMRALYSPYPQSFFIYKGKKYFVNGSEFLKENTKKVKFAYVKGVKDDRILIGLADGELVINSMEDQNRVEYLPMKEFKTGDKFYDN